MKRERVRNVSDGKEATEASSLLLLVVATESTEYNVEILGGLEKEQ